MNQIAKKLYLAKLKNPSKNS